MENKSKFFKNEGEDEIEEDLDKIAEYVYLI